MSWNADVDFDGMSARMRTAIVSRSAENKWFKKPERKMKTAILWICLRNGCRLSEGIEAFNNFVATKERRQNVRIRKRGYQYAIDDGGRRRRTSPGGVCEKPVDRLVIIPSDVPETLPSYGSGVPGLSNWCIRVFGVNPHALRYAFITHMGRQGIAPQLVARITGQQTLDMVLRYTETAAAEDLLEMSMLK